MADNNLTGIVPGLLRRCSPVLWRNESAPEGIWRGVLITAPGDDKPPLVAWTASDGVTVDEANGFDARDLILDLSDDTGLTHAWWWVQSNQRLPQHNGVIAGDAYGDCWVIYSEPAVVGAVFGPPDCDASSLFPTSGRFTSVPGLRPGMNAMEAVTQIVLYLGEYRIPFRRIMPGYGISPKVE